jgi:hypothetical protein
MSRGPSGDNKLDVRVRRDVYERIVEFQQASGLPSVAAALRALIVAGLAKRGEFDKAWEQVTFQEARRQVIGTIMKSVNGELEKTFGDLL